jgi:prephenate dehydrogenase
MMESKEYIGILGCGHLGLAFAIKLRENTPNKILISYSGRLTTLQRIKTVGLEQNISSNESIVENCSIFFYSHPVWI